ncbi:MAG TPA: hypothetical protein VJB87_01925 [Candidatus Nanoarchaeia archaeon]|nr:hypothetical protein [Candidatus Nanoarchaeia archaeon]
MQKRLFIILALLLVLPFVVAEDTTISDDQNTVTGNTLTDKIATGFKENIKAFEFIIFFLLFLVIFLSPLAKHFGEHHKAVAFMIALVLAIGLMWSEENIMKGLTGEAGRTYFSGAGVFAFIIIGAIALVAIYWLIRHLSGANITTLMIMVGLIFLLELAIIGDWYELGTKLGELSLFSDVDLPTILQDNLLVPTIFLFGILLVFSIFKKKNNKPQFVMVPGGKP